MFSTPPNGQCGRKGKKAPGGYPKAAQRYRKRKAPSGTKSDHLDAWSFADALRLDWAHWRPLARQDRSSHVDNSA